MALILTSIGLGELHADGVPVDVQHGPQGAAGVDAAEEQALLLPVDAVVHVPRACGVEEEQDVVGGVALAQGLGPVARLVGQVGAGVAGEVDAADGRRVHAGEAEAQDARPAGVGLHKANVNLGKVRILRLKKHHCDCTEER